LAPAQTLMLTPART